MPSTLPLYISQVTFGGDASDNPPNYSYTDFSSYPGLPGGQAYVRQNIIYYDSRQGVTYQVTALLVLGPGGKPQTAPTDLCYSPCPPLCAI